MRLIPNELGYLLAILIHVVRPIKATVVAQFFTPANQKAMMKKLYSTRLFVTYGQEWDSTKLSLLLKTWWVKNMKVPFGLNLHRQFAVGLQCKFLSYPKDDPTRTAALEGFAHGEKGDEMNYSCLQGDPSIPLSRQALFDSVCKDWFMIFGVRNPGLYRESLWDDSDIFQ
jgi:hypothetical protein